MAVDPLGFVGPMPFAPPAPALPAPGDVVPTPARRRYDGLITVDSPAVAIDAPASGRAAAELLRMGLFRSGVASSDHGYPIALRLEPGGADSDEAYRVDADGTGMTVTASSVAGLARGSATACQLVWRAGGGLQVAAGEIHDRPVVALRMLGGWGLYRADRLDWALDIAAEGKFNRVLYNWWAATPDERMGPKESALVERARRLGVEVVVELRRQALGPSFSLADRSSVATLLRHYDDAIDHGVRAFGFLFDDTDVDPFELELALVNDIVDHLRRRLGAEPEFWFCPRFYWFPGQMDYSWMQGAQPDGGDDGPTMAPMLGQSEPRTVEAAVARQREYQSALAAALPAGTHVYLANWWSGTPEGWERDLQEGWLDGIGRAPVFWDNQQQNDFRAALVLPIPLHQRPADFARALDGYTLNSGVPMSAFAPASVTAGAWAWNPDGYQPAAAFGAAIARFYGDASPAVIDALGAWSALCDDLLSPRQGMESHYRGMWQVAKAGQGESLRERLAAVAALLAKAGTLLPARAHPLCRHALAELAREVDRLHLDLELAELVVAGGDPDEARRLVAAITEILAERLPPVPELRDVLAGLRAPDDSVPGISWLLHFVSMPVRAGPARLLARLTGGEGAA